MGREGRAVTMLRPRKGLGDNRDIPEMAVQEKRIHLETLRPVWDPVRGRSLGGCPGGSVRESMGFQDLRFRREAGTGERHWA